MCPWPLYLNTKPQAWRTHTNIPFSNQQSPQTPGRNRQKASAQRDRDLRRGTPGSTGLKKEKSIHSTLNSTN